MPTTTRTLISTCRRLLLVCISAVTISVQANSISGYTIGAPITSVFSEFFALNSNAGQQVIAETNAGTFSYEGQSDNSSVIPLIRCQSLPLTSIDQVLVATKLTDRAFEPFYEDEKQDLQLLEYVRNEFNEQTFKLASVIDTDTGLGNDTAQFYRSYNPLFECSITTSPSKDEQFSNSVAAAFAQQIISRIPDYREGLEQIDLVFSPYGNIQRIALKQLLYAPDMPQDEVFAQPVGKWGPLFDHAKVIRRDHSLLFETEDVTCRFDAIPVETGYKVENSCQSTDADEGKYSEADNSHRLPIANPAKVSDYFIDWLERHPQVRPLIDQARMDIAARLSALKQRQRPVHLIL